MLLHYDQEVEKLVGVLRKLPADQRDDVVVRAKNQLEAERVKIEDLKKLFVSQIQTLKSRGCPKQILEMAYYSKTEVVQKASRMTIIEGYIPFVGPVIPPAYLGYYGLMAMVRNRDNEGYVCLDPSRVTDKVETPEGLYWLYGVEDGEAMLGKTPQNAEEAINKQGRFILTAAETMALCTHSNVLLRHYVDATGSRYNGTDRVPFVYLDNGGCPNFNWHNVVANIPPEWGSPSCGSR